MGITSFCKVNYFYRAVGAGVGVRDDPQRLMVAGTGGAVKTAPYKLPVHVIS